MKLSVELVFDNLPERMHPQLLNAGNGLLSLDRPRLYEGSDAAFAGNHLYLVKADRLPARAHADRTAAIVCIGDSPRLARYASRCAVIRLDEDADFYATFNEIQAVFDKYDAWEDRLDSIAAEDADISRMLTESESVLDNALYAIDADFKILGASNLASQLGDTGGFRSEDGTSLRLSSFDTFLQNNELRLEEEEPLRIEISGESTLNYNLHSGGEYRGCVTVHYRQRPYRPSDEPVLKHLGSLLLRAIERLSSGSSDSHGALRHALRDLVEGIPLDAFGKESVRAAQGVRRFACMRLKLPNRLANLPLGYVRSMLESAFPKSIAFEHHRNSVVTFIDLGELDKNKPYDQAIRELADSFTSSMGCRAGLSDPVVDLMQARLYYLQANIALENGMLYAPLEGMHRFQDYALEDMVINSLGELPLELLYPPGLLRLIEHDADSPTSYVETLRSYLENNQNVTKTAAALYVHRSTLMERLTRIKRDLGLDFEDPDVQLRLRLLLKAEALRERVRTGGSLGSQA